MRPERLFAQRECLSQLFDCFRRLAQIQISPAERAAHECFDERLVGTLVRNLWFGRIERLAQRDFAARRSRPFGRRPGGEDLLFQKLKRAPQFLSRLVGLLLALRTLLETSFVGRVLFAHLRELVLQRGQLLLGLCALRRLLLRCRFSSQALAIRPHRHTRRRSATDHERGEHHNSGEGFLEHIDWL
ncbi:MAG TPA: hypothetical protein VHD36_00940 [Pirellulales bacterium]|nr:hypothetical protein [Pirellulales bacterium]